MDRATCSTARSPYLSLTRSTACSCSRSAPARRHAPPAPPALTLRPPAPPPRQRSDAKITFPAYWANTCCSHPLYVDDEVKGVEGAITAARRKMEQELGIPPEDVPPDSFRFVSRVHYKARSDDVWGEHEIDYILLCQPPGDVRVSPNANEVQNTGWFTPDELRAFIEQSNKTCVTPPARAPHFPFSPSHLPCSGDLISPWFRAIEAYRLHHWWQAAARGDVKTLEADTETIHRVDASAALHCDGVGAEGTVGGDASRKQGAYGLVPTHKHSAFSVLAYPAELFAALRYKLGGGLGGGPVSAPAGADPALVDAFSFCDTILVSVSRSFASVIHQLDPPMRRAICVFYLALRALDTVEDDTAVQHEPKRVALRAFWRKLDDVDFTVHGVGKGDERRLLENMPFLARAFRSLPGREAAVIRDITRLMGRGMAEFVGADLRQGTDDVAQYNRYCHHVAGLVGEGLSKLFTASGAEAASVAADLPRANHMGLFLQKTNIIRDYLEDLVRALPHRGKGERCVSLCVCVCVCDSPDRFGSPPLACPLGQVEGRAFWPRSVWSKYGDSLGALAEAGNREQAVACLDELVADALGHAPHSLAYLDQLRSPSVFKFCAIPQLMAIATLYECLHEPRVFTGVIKMRKTLAVQMITDCSDMRAVRRWFALYARRIAAKAQSSAAREACVTARLPCGGRPPSSSRPPHALSRPPPLLQLAGRRRCHAARVRPAGQPPRGSLGQFQRRAHHSRLHRRHRRRRHPPHHRPAARVCPPGVCPPSPEQPRGRARRRRRGRRRLPPCLCAVGSGRERGRRPCRGGRSGSGPRRDPARCVQAGGRGHQRQRQGCGGQHR